MIHYLSCTASCVLWTVHVQVKTWLQTSDLHGHVHVYGIANISNWTVLCKYLNKAHGRRAKVTKSRPVVGWRGQGWRRHRRAWIGRRRSVINNKAGAFTLIPKQRGKRIAGPWSTQTCMFIDWGRKVEKTHKDVENKLWWSLLIALISVTDISFEVASCTNLGACGWSQTAQER